MQGPTAAFQAIKPQFPEQEQHLKCPRCDSTNTKFCYYNNYNLSQPRHFCKNCRRYWTKGGALRNIPVGGGTRKNSKRSSSSNPKRSNSSTSSITTATSTSTTNPTTTPLHIPEIEPFSAIYPHTADPDHQMLDISGSFSSLLASNGNFGNLLDSFESVGPGILGLHNSGDLNHTMGGSALELQSSRNGYDSGNPPPPLENFLGLQGDSSCCIGANGWSDLAIYTPCSSFQ